MKVFLRFLGIHNLKKILYTVKDSDISKIYYTMKVERMRYKEIKMKRLLPIFLVLLLLVTTVSPSISYAKKSETDTETTKSKTKTSDTKKSDKDTKKSDAKTASNKDDLKDDSSSEDKKKSSEKESSSDEAATSKKEDTQSEPSSDEKTTTDEASSSSDSDSSTAKDETAIDKDSSTSSDEASATNDSSTEEETQTTSTASATHTVVTDESIKSPKVTSSAAILMDAKTGAILYEKNQDKKHYPASITKILTTLVALENADLDDNIKFTKKVLNSVEQDSSRIGVEPKEEIPLEDCLYAVMLASANDVSAGVAANVGGSVKKFAKMMNEKAEQLGCKNSNFVNPHGLHDKKHYTTAYDIALITQDAIQNKDFCKIASTLTHTIPKTKKTVEKRYLSNHDKMLQDTKYHYDGIEYGKTGYTKKAGNTLVSVAKKGDLELICVVLEAEGYDNAYKDTKRLFNYGFDNYHVVTPLEDFPLSQKLVHTKYFESVSVEDMEKLNPTVATDFSVVLPNSVTEDDLTYKFYISPNDDTGQLGSIEVQNGEELLTTLPVSYDPPLDQIEIERQPEVIHVTSDDPIPVRIIKRALAHRNLLAFLIASFILIVILIVGVRSITSSQSRKKRKLKK